MFQLSSKRYVNGMKQTNGKSEGFDTSKPDNSQSSRFKLFIRYIGYLAAIVGVLSFGWSANSLYMEKASADDLKKVTSDLSNKIDTANKNTREYWNDLFSKLETRVQAISSDVSTIKGSIDIMKMDLVDTRKKRRK